MYDIQHHKTQMLFPTVMKHCVLLLSQIHCLWFLTLRDIGLHGTLVLIQLTLVPLTVYNKWPQESPLVSLCFERWCSLSSIGVVLRERLGCVWPISNHTATLHPHLGGESETETLGVVRWLHVHYCS